MIDFTNYIKVVIVNATGLSTQRHSRRIKHPLAMNNIGKPAPYFIQYLRVIVSKTRGQDNEPSGLDRKRSRPLRSPMWRIALRLVIRLCLNNIGQKTMIYTFLIANKHKLADLNPNRKISVCADTEHQARQALNGLPLLFVSKTATRSVE